jgi:hypothetical protein
MIRLTRLALRTWGVAVAALGGLAGSLLLVGACVGYLDADAGAADATGSEPEGGGDAGSACNAGNYATQVLEAGPLLYLRFDEDSGTVAHDALGKFNGTYPAIGVTLGAQGALLSDPCNTAFHITDPPGVRVPQSADFAGNSSQFTVEVWIHPDVGAPDTQGGGNAGFIVDHNVYPPRAGWDLILSQSATFEAWASTGKIIGALGNATPMPGSWHYVVAEYDETGAQIAGIWLDDQLMTQQVPAGTLTADPSGWTVGAQNCPECNQTNFVGAIDDLAIYPYLLKQSDVDSHWKAAGYN